MLAEAISATLVLATLNKIEPFGPHVPQYAEVAEAITQASNHDPLFPEDKDGSRKTAAILVSLAWFESRFHPNAVGDNGRSFGLFQIQPPTAKVESNILTNPRTASYIAVDLIRRSFQACAKRPYEERLSWYVSSNGCPSSPIIVKKSMDRLLMATRILPMLNPPPPPALSPRK
jgi:hypothetical protein